MGIVSKIAIATTVLALAVAPAVAEAESGVFLGTSNGGSGSGGGLDKDTRGLVLIGGGIAFGTGMYFLTGSTKSN
jgi:hypothetical protein